MSLSAEQATWLASRELMRSERMLTLTGLGGCGKTRLAIEAASRLAEAGETPGSKLRHVSWFRALAEQARSAVEGGDPRSGFAIFHQDYANLLAALATCADSGDEVGLILADALFPLWVMQRRSEGLSWLEHLLGVQGNDALVSAAARQGAVLSRLLGDHQGAGRMLEFALAAGRRCEDPGVRLRTPE